MKRILFFILLNALFAATHAKKALHVQVQATTDQQTQIPISIHLINPNAELETIGSLLVANLSCTKQCSVTMQHHAKPQTKQEIIKLSKQADLAIFIEKNEKKSAFDWRIYDTNNAQMVASKRVSYKDISIHYCAQKISSQIWKSLMNEDLDFTAPIALCKKREFRKKQCQDIYITDFAGTTHKKIVANNSFCFTPRWMSTTDRSPLLFFSEYTKSNIKLMVTNMFGKQKVLSNFDGLNMQPAYSPNGKHMVYCLSKDGSSQLYYCKEAKRKKICSRITHNTSNNLAPCFIDNDRIAFVSDHNATSPKIYLMNLKTKKVEQLTTQGYCACPAYSSAKKQLCYGKIMQGVMQIFIYDFGTKQHTQITFTQDNKEEMSWSPCGSCIIFASTHQEKKRIGILHLASNNIHYITKSSESWSYPDWGPHYPYTKGLL